MTGLELVAAIGAALAAIVYIARQARKAAKVGEVIASVIQRELHPNGGASLHDKVTWIETQLLDHGARLERIEHQTHNEDETT